MMVARPMLFCMAFACIGLLPNMAAANNDCRLCEAKPDSGNAVRKADIPVSIDITTRLNFTRVALTGNGNGGQVKVNPQSGGTIIQGSVIDMGGYSLAGTAIVRGEPGRFLRIDLPASIRMTSSTGGVMELIDIQTDLSPAPRLDANGQLSFSFGGALQVNGNISGKFRGRIPITAQYE